jgi:hypothetical protein
MRENLFIENPATPAKGTTCFRSFSIGNDLFTTVFTAQMGRGKIQCGVFSRRMWVQVPKKHVKYLQVWPTGNSAIRIAKKFALFYRHCSNRIDFTPFSLVFKSTLVVKMKKTQESTPSILKRTPTIRRK